MNIEEFVAENPPPVRPKMGEPSFTMIEINYESHLYLTKSGSGVRLHIVNGDDHRDIHIPDVHLEMLYVDISAYMGRKAVLKESLEVWKAAMANWRESALNRITDYIGDLPINERMLDQWLIGKGFYK